jgi:hypothetical protein
VKQERDTVGPVCIVGEQQQSFMALSRRPTGINLGKQFAPDIYDRLPIFLMCGGDGPLSVPDSNWLY